MHKYKKYIRFVMVPVMCILFYYILYTLVDILSMGVIADWVDSKFVYETSNIDNNGTTTIIRTFDWVMIKEWLFQVILITVLAGSIIWVKVSDYQRKKQQQKTAHIIAEYMKRYIMQEEPVPAVEQTEYSEVFERILEVRAAVQMKEQLLRMESQRKNDLITYLAHDLKTPLTSVIGYLTFLQEEPELPKKQRMRYIEIAFKKAERLEELLAELFEITRFNLTQIELSKEKVNLSVMTEQIAYEFLPLLTEKNLQFDMDIEPGAVCMCDVDKMERIVDNLIRNAISYSYPDSEIKISVHTKDNRVCMTFQNYGKTIPQEKLERIFEQFFRLDSARSSKTGGSGLGLAIAKQLMEAHGGTIKAESEDEIIRFTVSLPTKLQDTKSS